jgi:hypothetical protein
MTSSDSASESSLEFRAVPPSNENQGFFEIKANLPTKPMTLLFDRASEPMNACRLDEYHPAIKRITLAVPERW